MRIGLSYNTADLGLNPGGIDGIGVYTQFLYQHLKAIPSLDVSPVIYKHVDKYAHCLAQNGYSFTHSFMRMLELSFIPFYPKQDLSKKIDVYHATDHMIPPLKKTPVVATLHDAIMLKHPEWCSVRLRKIKNMLFKYTAQKAKKIIAISEAAVPDLVAYFNISEKNISVVHHGIDPIWSQPLSDDLTQKTLIRFNLNKKFILFVGTLQPRKNILRMIQAFTKLPEELRRQHPLVLVGRNGWQTKELMIEIKKWENTQQLFWLQHVDFQSLRVLYQQAHCLLFPSLYEGFGFPILEAFASQTPVITSNITSMPEIAGDAALLVDPYSVESIHSTLEKLLLDPICAQELVQKGLARLPLFSWKNCAKNTLAVYESAI